MLNTRMTQQTIHLHTIISKSTRSFRTANNCHLEHMNVCQMCGRDHTKEWESEYVVYEIRTYT